MTDDDRSKFAETYDATMSALHFAQAKVAETLSKILQEGDQDELRHHLRELPFAAEMLRRVRAMAVKAMHLRPSTFIRRGDNLEPAPERVEGFLCTRWSIRPSYHPEHTLFTFVDDVTGQEVNVQITTPSGAKGLESSLEQTGARRAR